MTPPTSGHKNSDVAFVLLVLALGMALRVAVLLTYERDVDGDEAVVGLMALRIWRDGESFSSWPGRRYNGGAAINAYLAALAFRCCGASSLALKAPALLWTAGALVLGYLLAREFLGLQSARWALLLMALAPATFCRWGVKPYLGTNATLINLAIAYSLFKTLFGAKGRKRVVWPVLTGAFCGLGLYNSPFVLPMLLACAVLGGWIWRGAFRRPGLWLGILSFAITAAPTLVAMWQGEAAELTPRSGVASLGLAVARAGVKVPHFFGRPYRYFGAPRLPVSGAISAACCLIALGAVIVLGCRRLWRAVTHARQRGGQDVPALAVVFALFFLAAHAGAFVLSPQDVQYLLPAYPFLALAVAAALTFACERGRAVAWRLGAWGLAAALLLANTYGSLGLTLVKEKNGFDKYVYGGVEYRRLSLFLEAKRIKHVYASSAIAHLLRFESTRRIVAVSYDNVFPDDTRSVDRSKAYAYVFCIGSDYDRLLRSYLRGKGIEFSEGVIGPWIVRYGLQTHVRPGDINWETDCLGCFPSRVDLCEAALRLEPWRAGYWCRLLEIRERSVAPQESSSRDEPTARGREAANVGR